VGGVRVTAPARRHAGVLLRTARAPA
jgi:hypothetical protein